MKEAYEKEKINWLIGKKYANTKQTAQNVCISLHIVVN